MNSSTHSAANTGVRLANQGVHAVVGAFNATAAELDITVDTTSVLPYINITSAVDPAYVAIGGILFEGIMVCARVMPHAKQYR